MQPQKISQNIVKSLLPAVFLTVTLFSLYLADALTWNILLFSVFKGIIATIFAWLFFLVVFDAIVKSISDSFSGMSEKRKEGGLIYHLIKPAENEIPPKQDGHQPGKKKKNKK